MSGVGDAVEMSSQGAMSSLGAISKISFDFLKSARE